MKSIILFFTVLFFSLQVVGNDAISPYNELKSIEKDARGFKAFELLTVDRLVNDPTSVLGNIETILDLSKTLGDNSLKSIYFETKANFFSLEYDAINEYSTKFHQQAIEEAEANGLPKEYMRQLYNFGNYYFTYSKNGDAYYYFKQAVNELDKIGDKNIYAVWKYLITLSRYFYAIKEFEVSKDLLKRVLKFEKRLTSRERLDTKNTLALIFLQENNLSESKKLFENVYNDASQVLDSAWIGISKGNLGSVYLKENNFHAALEAFQEDYVLNSTPRGEVQSALSALFDIANVQFKLEQYEESLNSIHEYLEKIEKKPVRYKNIVLSYELKFKLNEKLGNKVIQEQDLKEYNHFSKLLQELNSNLSVEQAKVILEKEKYQSLIETDSKIMKYQILFICLLSIFCLTIIVYLLKVYFKKIKRKRHMYPLNGNNSLELLDSNQKEEILELSEIDILLHKNIVNKSRWDEFKVKFEKLYPDFFSNLRTDYPNLTDSDLRLLALLELSLSNRDISAALSISIDGVKKAKQRLKQKMGQRSLRM